MQRPHKKNIGGKRRPTTPPTIPHGNVTSGCSMTSSNLCNQPEGCSDGALLSHLLSFCNRSARDAGRSAIVSNLYQEYAAIANMRMAPSTLANFDWRDKTAYLSLARRYLKAKISSPSRTVERMTICSASEKKSGIVNLLSPTLADPPFLGWLGQYDGHITHRSTVAAMGGRTELTAG
jgi:hypothetical protein